MKYQRFLLWLPALCLWFAACAPAPRLQGTDLERTPAPDFQLMDQGDRPVRLSDLRGHPVVLTFLYTNCPDECPLIAERLRESAAQLGRDASDVRFVAVSLDPERDTSAAIRQFLQAHRVEGLLTYLRGTRAELAAVWKAYFLAVLPGGNPALVSHQSRVIVIDRHGLQRSNFGADVSVDGLVNDVRIALAERP
ncbi:MAG: SCO family protein [Chloroflexi bacterium]|nr:SCO family protein [Chloroflexota bacterium]